MGQSIAAAATSALNNELTEQYLENIYVGFNTTGKQFRTVAKAADDLSHGDPAGGRPWQVGRRWISWPTGPENQLDSGAHQLSTGATQFEQRGQPAVDRSRSALRRTRRSGGRDGSATEADPAAGRHSGSVEADGAGTVGHRRKELATEFTDHRRQPPEPRPTPGSRRFLRWLEPVRPRDQDSPAGSARKVAERRSPRTVYLPRRAQEVARDISGGCEAFQARGDEPERTAAVQG